MNSKPQLYSNLIAIITFVVGELVAFVPSLGTDKQNIIAAGSAILASVLSASGSVHHLAQVKGNAMGWSSTPPAAVPVPVASTTDILRTQLKNAGIEPAA